MFKFKDCFNYLTDNEIDLKILKKVEKENTINKAPTYVYAIILNNHCTFVGKIDLKIGDVSNNNILMGGNINYHIEEEFKNNNYEFEACLLLEEVALSHDMEFLTIACSFNDEKKKLIIEMLGYQYCDTIEVEKGTSAYLLGYRLRTLYEKNLTKKNIRRR